MAKPKKIELFDFARLVGGHISFVGSYSPENTFVNADLKQGYQNCYVNGGLGIFGRSNRANLDEALADLASELSEKTIHFETGFRGPAYSVPALKHTKGYRG
jgi:hypothetical protein